jgi:hypothetical protein
MTTYEQRMAYRRSPKGKAMLARVHRKHWFGLTEEQYQVMLERQGGLCAICKQDLPLGIDHDRRCCNGKASCGKCIRGALCNSCNNGLGRFRDDVDRLRAAIAYLEEFSDV